MARPKKEAQTGEQAQATSLPLYTAAMRFQDITGLKDAEGDPLFYEVGEDVSHFEQNRLVAGVERGIIQYNEPTETTEETESGTDAE